MRLTRPRLCVAVAITVSTSVGVWKLWHHMLDKYNESPLYEVDDMSASSLFNVILLDKSRAVSSMEVNYLSDWREVEVRKSNNGHPESGALRDAARRGLSEQIHRSGCEEYDISPSARDTGGARHHEHIVAQDLHAGVQHDEVTDNHIILGIDCDYYLSEKGLSALLAHNRPIAFYTFQPDKVSGYDGDTPYTIRDNYINYNVSGGSCWNHRVWDWRGSGDHFRSAALEPVRQQFGHGLLGRVGKLCAQLVCNALRIKRYHVFKRIPIRPWASNNNRIVVWLIPAFSYLESGWFARRLRVEPAKRVNYQSVDRPGWNLLQRRGDGENASMTSFGREGCENCTELPTDLFELLMGNKTAQSNSTRLNQANYDGSVIANFNQYYTNSPFALGERLTLSATARPDPVPFYPPTMVDEPDKVSWRNISPPLVGDHNLVPMIKRYEALEQSLGYRVTRNINNTVPGKAYSQYAREFVELLIPKAGLGVPYSLEETMEHLNKPTQVAGIQRVMETIEVTPKAEIEAFIKNEPTMKPNRIISAFPDARYLLNLSSFSLRVRDEELHKHRWFCPGQTPIAIAQRVQDFSIECGGEPMESDFSSFDGTVSAWLQENITCAAYMRYFAPVYRTELRGYLALLTNCRSKMKRFGVRYESGPGIKSGSPPTCDGNTAIAAYTQYCAIRRSFSHLTPPQALEMIGLVFGDDTLARKEVAGEFKRVCRDLGLSVKIENFNHVAGTTFLARVFPDPVKTLTSFQDPLRTLRKLHLTSRPTTVPLADAACDRVEGYLVTDARTPIIGDYCRTIKRFYENDAASYEKRMSRGDRSADRPYWSRPANAGNCWPQYKEDDELVLNCMAERIGLRPNVVVEFSQYIAAIDNIHEMQQVVRDDGDPWPYAGTCLPSGEVMALEGERLTTNYNAIDKSTKDVVVNTRPIPDRPCPRGAGNSTGGNGGRGSGAGRDQERPPNAGRVEGRGEIQRGAHSSRDGTTVRKGQVQSRAEASRGARTPQAGARAPDGAIGRGRGRGRGGANQPNPRRGR